MVLLFSLFLLLQALLFFFLSEPRSLFFLFDSHQICQYFICLFRCLIGKPLSLLNNLDAFLVAPLYTDSQWCVTCLVTLEDVDLGVGEDVGQYFFVENRPGCQVQDVGACTTLFDCLISVLGEENFDHFEVGFGAYHSELKGCEVVQLWLQLVCQVIWRLLALKFDKLVG